MGPRAGLDENLRPQASIAIGRVAKVFCKVIPSSSTSLFLEYAGCSSENNDIVTKVCNTNSRHLKVMIYLSFDTREKEFGIIEGNRTTNGDEF